MQTQKAGNLLFKKVTEFLTLKDLEGRGSFMVIVRSAEPQCGENCGELEELVHYFIPFHS